MSDDTNVHAAGELPNLLATVDCEGRWQCPTRCHDPVPCHRPGAVRLTLACAAGNADHPPRLLTVCSAHETAMADQLRGRVLARWPL